MVMLKIHIDMYPGNQTAIGIIQDFIVGYLVPTLVNSGLPPHPTFHCLPFSALLYTQWTAAYRVPEAPADHCSSQSGGGNRRLKVQVPILGESTSAPLGDSAAQALGLGLPPSALPDLGWLLTTPPCYTGHFTWTLAIPPFLKLHQEKTLRVSFVSAHKVIEENKHN